MKKYFFYFTIALALYGCDSNDSNSVSINNSEKTIQSSEQTELWARVSKAGLFKVVRSGGIIDHPKSSTGKVISKPVIELVEITDHIPLIQDAHMSLQYRIGYLPTETHWLDLRRVLIHPEMTLPNGSTTTGSDYTFKAKVSVGQVIGYTGYGLNEDYEMLEGEWIFQLWHEDIKLIEQSFFTYKPDKNELQKIHGLLKS